MGVCVGVWVWVYGCMGAWVHGCIVHGCMGVCLYMRAWVRMVGLYGCMGVWVHGCMGVWVYVGERQVREYMAVQQTL